MSQPTAAPLAPRPPQLLRELIRVYDDVLPASFCDDMIARFEADARKTRVESAGQMGFDQLDVHDAPDWQPVMDQLMSVQSSMVSRYMQETMGSFPSGLITENVRIKRYQAERGDQFANHVDVYDWVTARRLVVLFYYLNDVEVGGETDFPQLRVRVRAKRGRLVMFPPYWMYLHAGLPPVSSAKYIIGTYITFDR